MKFPERGTKGFTLIELLIVIAILGVLAAVVIPNVVGLMGRGGEQSYETDQKNLQLATSTFYSDTHAGFYDSGATATNRWGCNCTERYAEYLGSPNVQLAEDPGHYYPTSIGFPSSHVLYLDTATDPGNEQFEAFKVLNAAGGDATDADIQAHAMWMGLLFNEAGDTDTPLIFCETSDETDAGDATACDNAQECCSVDAACGTTDRWNVGALAFEGALYIQEYPDSAMATNNYNGDPGRAGGGYAWVVGDRGSVYGCYKSENIWYAGFSGAYP